MNPEFIAILQKLIAEQGREALLNAAKCKAFLSDYTRNEYKRESRLLLQALDAGVQKAIEKAENITICKKQQIRYLHEDYSLDEKLAAGVVNTLALVLRGDASRTEIRKEEPQTPTEQPQQPAPRNDTALKIGSIIPFGSYKWRVLDVQGGEALIITEDVIEVLPYNEKYEGSTWETRNLRNYLNNEFLQKFTKEQQGRIVETTNHNLDNLWYGTMGGNDTHDKIFLLSLEEVDKYFGNSGDYLNKMRKKYDNGKWIADSDGRYIYNNHDGDRVANYRGEGACDWWLRSPGLNNHIVAYAGAFCISVDVLGDDVNAYYRGVRPALWLKV